MTTDDKCPACGAAPTTTGHFFGRRPMGFLPAGLRFWTMKARPIAFTRGVDPRACPACGLVWVRVDPAELRQVIAGAGKK